MQKKTKDPIAIGASVITLTILLSSCALITTKSLKKFECTLATVKPNPSGFNYKGKSISYFEYNTGKREIIHISNKQFIAKSYGQEEILARPYAAYERDGILLWGGTRGGFI
jgi:hypothetical protein